MEIFLFGKVKLIVVMIVEITIQHFSAVATGVGGGGGGGGSAPPPPNNFQNKKNYGDKK